MIYNLLTSKRKKSIIIPESWTDKHLTTGMFQKIVKWDGKSLIDLFSILSGIEVKVLENTYDPALEARLLEATNFVYTPFDFKSLPRPEYLELNGKQYPVPDDIKGLTIGQNILVNQELQKCTVYEELISYTMAVYMWPIVNPGQEYNHSQAMKLQAEIDKLPISKTYPIGFFLLKPRQRFGQIITRLASRMFRTMSSIFTRNGKASQRTRN